MKNFFLCGLIAITLPCCVQAQPDSAQIESSSLSSTYLVGLADRMYISYDSVKEFYSHAYDDVLRCSAGEDAVFDTVCYLNLSKRFAETSIFLYRYSKLLRETETPVWIQGQKWDFYVPFYVPPSEEVDELVIKFDRASADVLACVRGRARAVPCNGVSLSVSDAVNSLGRAMGWLKK